MGKGIIVLTFLGTTEGFGQIAIWLFEAKTPLVLGLENDVANGQYLLGRDEYGIGTTWLKSVLIDICLFLG